MELRVNDYVRTKDGKIGKIIQEEYITPCNDKHRYIYLTDADNEMWYDEDTIIKSKSKIRDLIETGDHVNGERIQFITNKGQLLTDGGYNLFKKYEDIKSIVTKEQFESMEYKVGD